MKRLLFVLAFSSKDPDQALDLTEWMLEMGCQFDDPALVVTSMNAQGLPQVGQIIYNLQKVFSSVQHYQLTDEDERVGWYPQNHMFRSTAKYIEHLIKDVDGFYFIEPDVLPIKRDWWDKIREEYSVTDMPFMGDIVSASSTRDDVNLHTNGSCVYPRDVAAHCTQILRCYEDAWDFACRDLIVPLTQKTNLIQTLFNTINYREVDGKIVTRKVLPDGTLKGQQDAGPEFAITDEAVVVHGCKDGSLLRILRDRRAGIKPKLIVATTAGKGSVAKVMKENDTLATVAKLKQKRSPLARACLTQEEEKNVKALVVTMELFCRNAGATARVREILNESELIAV